MTLNELATLMNHSEHDVKAFIDCLAGYMANHPGMTTEQAITLHQHINDQARAAWQQQGAVA
jgi:hypothetical protein